MRLSQLFAPLVFATLVSVSYAQNDLDSIIDEGPSWTAGGHYTAELDLSAKTLTLLPLTGTDQVIGFATLNTPSDLSPGVYVLDVTDNEYTLISTHPDGVVGDAFDSRQIVAGDKGEASALSLSAQAFAILSGANVGAIYIH
jgi:hypothetical protein